MYVKHGTSLASPIDGGLNQSYSMASLSSLLYYIEREQPFNISGGWGWAEEFAPKEVCFWYFIEKKFVSGQRFIKITDEILIFENKKFASPKIRGNVCSVGSFILDYLFDFLLANKFNWWTFCRLYRKIKSLAKYNATNYDSITSQSTREHCLLSASFLKP